MNSLTSWKDYLVQTYNYVVSEAWQLGADAKNEAYNIYSDAWTNTADVVNDIAYSERSWTEVTDSPIKNEDENNEKSDIFTVEANYMPNSKSELMNHDSNEKLCIKDASNSETSI